MTNRGVKKRYSICPIHKLCPAACLLCLHCSWDLSLHSFGSMWLCSITTHLIPLSQGNEKWPSSSAGRALWQVCVVSLCVCECVCVQFLSSKGNPVIVKVLNVFHLAISPRGEPEYEGRRWKAFAQEIKKNNLINHVVKLQLKPGFIYFNFSGWIIGWELAHVTSSCGFLSIEPVHAQFSLQVCIPDREKLKASMVLKF